MAVIDDAKNGSEHRADDEASKRSGRGDASATAGDSGEVPQREPRGFGEHARGLTAEYAHEQGWGLEEEQRTRLPEGVDDTSGGSDYEYGARDFGDEPTNTDRFKSEPDDVGPRD